MLVRIGSCGKGKKKKSVPRCSTAFFYGACLHRPTPLPTPTPLIAHTVKCRPQFARFFTRTGHFHSLVRPGIDRTQHALAASPFRPTDTAKKQALFRSKLVNFSPNPPHFSHAEAHFVRPSRPFTHAHTRTPSLFDFAFTLQEKSIQNTD